MQNNPLAIAPSSVRICYIHNIMAVNGELGIDFVTLGMFIIGKALWSSFFSIFSLSEVAAPGHWKRV